MTARVFGCGLPSKRQTAVVACPSEAAYQRARRRRREPCPGCRRAHAEYEYTRARRGLVGVST